MAREYQPHPLDAFTGAAEVNARLDISQDGIHRRTVVHVTRAGTTWQRMDSDAITDAAERRILVEAAAVRADLDALAESMRRSLRGG